MEDEYKEFEEEAQAVRSDLKRVLWTNGIILLVLVALYFINRTTGFLN
jgi:hypothetical protein